MPYIVALEATKTEPDNVENSLSSHLPLTASHKKPQVEQLHFAPKMRKRHERKLTSTFQHKKAYRPHFKTGKRVCINCESCQKQSNMIFCPQFGWQIVLEVAKTQQVCKE